jgi:hypothetical protein
MQTWFRARAEQNDLDLQRARFEELEAMCREIDVRVKRLEDAGVKEERPVTAKDELYSDFVQDLSRAQTDLRREALTNAAAQQFDPRMGSQAVRKYFFDRAAELTDVETLVVLQLQMRPLFFFESSGKLAFLKDDKTATDDAIPAADRMAIGVTMLSMGKKGDFVTETRRNIMEFGDRANEVRLTPAGSVLATFINEPD